jgi:hypothetical protein
MVTGSDRQCNQADRRHTMTDTDAARIIAALVIKWDAGIVYTRKEPYDRECAYCGFKSDFGGEYYHNTDCPVLAGRAWLAAQQAEAGDGE